MPHTITTAKVCKTRQARQATQLEMQQQEQNQKRKTQRVGVREREREGKIEVDCRLTGEWVGQLDSMSERERERRE